MSQIIRHKFFGGIPAKKDGFCSAVDVVSKAQVWLSMTFLGGDPAQKIQLVSIRLSSSLS